MAMAFFWGIVSGGAVLLGSVISLIVKIPDRLLGYIMAFGVGVLIGASTFELLDEALQKGTMYHIVTSFMVGAITFTILEALITKHGGNHRKRSNPEIHFIDDRKRQKQKNKASKNENESTGIGIFIGTVMDAIPESIMLGTTLIGGKGVSLLLLIAIFISNIPEGLSSTAGMLKSGKSKFYILTMFIVVTLVAGVCTLIGNVFFDHVPETYISIIASFAAGGIITMVGATMMPEAYEEGGATVGLITALGLITSVLLDQLG